jgi:hypothetical protein
MLGSIAFSLHYVLFAKNFVLPDFFAPLVGSSVHFRILAAAVSIVFLSSKAMNSIEPPMDMEKQPCAGSAAISLFFRFPPLLFSNRLCPHFTFAKAQTSIPKVSLHLL